VGLGEVEGSGRIVMHRHRETVRRSDARRESYVLHAAGCHDHLLTNADFLNVAQLQNCLWPRVLRAKQHTRKSITVALFFSLAVARWQEKRVRTRTRSGVGVEVGTMRSAKRQRLFGVRVTQRRFHLPASAEPDCRVFARRDVKIRAQVAECSTGRGQNPAGPHTVRGGHLVEVAAEDDARDAFLCHRDIVRRLVLTVERYHEHRSAEYYITQ